MTVQVLDRISATQQTLSLCAEDMIFVGKMLNPQSEDSPHFELSETIYPETMDHPIFSSEVPQE